MTMSNVEPLAPEGPARRRPLAAIAAAIAGVLIVLLVAILVVGRRDDSNSAATPLLNNPAPTARGEYADGTPFDLSRRKGSWVVLNFFTPDCIPCVREHPELERFVEQQRSIGLDGAEFYSIVQHASVAEVDEFFATYGGDWPVVYDNDFEFQTGFGVAQVPETWIIDPNGFVRGRVIGEVGSAQVLSSQIQQMRDAMAAGR